MYKDADVSEAHGTFFVIEQDVKFSKALGNQGKSILTILRHLGRTKEIRGGGLNRIAVPSRADSN